MPRPARRAGRRLLSDLSSGRAFLASELTQSSWHDFGAFRWRDVAGAQAVRAAIGVLTPLVVGVVTNHVEYGSYAALGALPAGFVSFRGVSWTRVAAVLMATAGMAVSTFVGGTAAEGLPWALIPIVLVWGYVTGLLAAIGPTALVVTLQWPVALLVGSAIPLEPGPAAIRAALVLFGGLWQCLLVVSSWITGRGSAERAAMGDSFRSLSSYAADLAAGRQGPPEPGALPGTEALTDPNPLLRTVDRQPLLDLVTEAERIRATLTALGAYRPDGVPSLAGRRFLTGAAEVLDHVAGTMTGRPRQRTAELAAARQVLSNLSAETGTSWQWSGEALLGQLRAACRIAARLLGREPARTGRRVRRRRYQATTQRDLVLTLRASLGASSEAGRHAIRLAVVAATAELIALASGLSHGYWAVLTVFIVLRPDYSSTVYRGLQRAAGTIVGAGLGVATVLLDHVGRSVLLAGIGVSLLAAYAVFTVNYLLYGVFLTDFVVVLLALLGLPPVPTALARLAGTGVGAGLALLAYVVWPSWGGTSASEEFAELVSAQGIYAAAVLRSYAAPPGRIRPRLSVLQVAARRTRIDADAAADRLAGEPDHPPMTAALASALVAATHQTAAACLTLTAAATAHESEDTDAALQPRLNRLAAGIEQATGQIAAALRELGEDPATPRQWPALPPLRTLQREIWVYRGTSAEVSPHPAPGDEEAGLVSGTDSLVDGINTTAHVLGFPT